MTQDHTPTRRPTLWLVIGGLLSVVGSAVLWPLQHVGQVCVLIYPAPPGCGAPQPRVAALAGIGMIIALFAAHVVFFVVSARSRVPLILLSAGVVVVVALAVAVIALSQTGIWAPYQPLVIID